MEKMLHLRRKLRKWQSALGRCSILAGFFLISLSAETEKSSPSNFFEIETGRKARLRLRIDFHEKSAGGWRWWITTRSRNVFCSDASFSCCPCVCVFCSRASFLCRPRVGQRRFTVALFTLVVTLGS